MLVYVRPSNEALPRARVPGAQDQRGCPAHPSLYKALAVLICTSSCTRSSANSLRSV